MLASFPASMLNQKPSDLGILNRLKLDPSRSRLLQREERSRAPQARPETVSFEANGEAKRRAQRPALEHIIKLTEITPYKWVHPDAALCLLGRHPQEHVAEEDNPGGAGSLPERILECCDQASRVGKATK
jgi:hypothetical protein